jgi:hypothetical protein
MSENQRTPKETIERIRTHRYLLDIANESEMVKEGALNLQTELNNALKLLSHDLYSKKSHFVLELIQNADDNHYSPDVTPQLTFQVAPERFVVVNNELGFSEPNIQAICSVGKSSKAGNKSGYIGEKGIGFKSVFTVSNAPEIHSNGYHFRFDRRDEANLLGYVVPEWCELPDGVNPEVTTIILPAGRKYQFDDKSLADLDARLLLFLAKLREVTLEYKDGKVTYRRLDDERLSRLSTERSSSAGVHTLEEAHYVRAEISFPMVNFEDEKRPGVDHASVVLAFPVDANGAANPEPSSHVFAFLPIRQIGFRFAIQADFILSSSREDILADRPWNLLLRAGIAQVFKAAIDTFKKSDALAFSFLKYLPAENDLLDPFFKMVGKELFGVLAKSECLPSESGKWQVPSELRIADKRFRELFPSATILELFGVDYVHQGVQGGSELLRRLGAKDVDTQTVLDLFTHHGEWLKTQPLDWRARFYAYIADQHIPLVTRGLLKIPCLPTADGTFLIPATSNVFFPLSKGRRYGFEQELVFVDNELFEQAQLHSDRVGELFSVFKVRTDDPYEMVVSHILARHKGEAWKTSEHKALIGHLRYVKDKLKGYLEEAAAKGKSEAQAFKVLRDGMWLGTKHLADGSWFFARADTLYISKEYVQPFCMELLLGDALPKISLVSADYLPGNSKNSDAAAEEWGDFFARLGLCTSPLLVSVGSDWHCSSELQLLFDSPHSAVRKAALECLDSHWQSYSGRLTYNVAVKSSIVQKDTKFALSLRASLAPTKKKATVALSDSYFPTPELKELLGDHLPYVDAILSAPVLDACRITHQLDANALIKRLKQLKAEGGDTAKQLQAIYRNLERFWDTESANIKQSFNTSALIRTKGIRRAWSQTDEVTWRSNSAFLDSLYLPLQGQYKDFSGFFLDKLGIPRDLSVSRMVEALPKLDMVVSLDERRHEALTIYRRANRDLTPRFGRDEPPAPAWLTTFENEAVFISHRGQMVYNDELLYANDSPEFAALFIDDANISFLGVPPSEVPRLARLLSSSCVQRLSTSLQIELIDVGVGAVDLLLTERVHRATYYLARVLYAKSHDNFEHVLQLGLFGKLQQVEVVEVPQVNLAVSLGDSVRETQADMAMGGGRIFYRSGAKSLKDRLAVELCKFLCAPEELTDIFARVLIEEDVNSIEDFLIVRNIGALPIDLQAALENAAGRLETDYESDDLSANDMESANIDEDGTLDKDFRNCVDELIDGAELPRTTVKPAFGTPPNFAELAVGTAGALPDGSDAVDVLPDTVSLHPSSALGAATRSLQTQSDRGSTAHQRETVPSKLEHTQNSPFVGGSESISPEANSAPTTSPPYSLESVAPWGRPGKLGTGGRRKRGRPTQHRPKLGRLMSYASGPVDGARPDPDDDPQRAADREATGRAAVAYFLSTQAARWKSLTEMPHNNPGFDVHGVAHDGTDEYIEVKGQSSVWSNDGVALTPTELMTAHAKGSKFWLCVVEYARDERRRRLYLLQDPYGLTQQFRFDSGWKSTAISMEAPLLMPEKDMFVMMPGIGRGRILSVRVKGRFFNLHVHLDDGRQVNRPFNPAKMTLSKDSAWQE